MTSRANEVRWHGTSGHSMASMLQPLALRMRFPCGPVAPSQEGTMRISGTLTVAFVLLAFPGGVRAQAPVSFDGVWKTPSDVVRGQPVPPPGKTGTGAKGKSTLVIEQTADSLIVTGGRVRSAYALDGTRTANYVLEGVDNKRAPVQSRAHWEGKELVLVDRYHLSDGLDMFVTSRLDIDANGNLEWRQRMVSQVGVMNLQSTYVPQRRLVP